jgi:hypothetical protein
MIEMIVVEMSVLLIPIDGSRNRCPLQHCQCIARARTKVLREPQI